MNDALNASPVGGVTFPEFLFCLMRRLNFSFRVVDC